MNSPSGEDLVAEKNVDQPSWDLPIEIYGQAMSIAKNFKRKYQNNISNFVGHNIRNLLGYTLW